jgi:hypothetical protein
MPLAETIVYLIAAVLLFPAFGGGVWLLESTLRQLSGLGQTPEGGNKAKVAAGVLWLAGFLGIIYLSGYVDSFLFFTIGIFIWEGIGLYGAYRWYELQEMLAIKELKVE